MGLLAKLFHDVSDTEFKLAQRDTTLDGELCQ